jgi:hypothetical protein
MPANAGIQEACFKQGYTKIGTWIPASAGITGKD